MSQYFEPAFKLREALFKTGIFFSKHQLIPDAYKNYSMASMKILNGMNYNSIIRGHHVYKTVISDL